jgi:hypothetical protein
MLAKLLTVQLRQRPYLFRDVHLRQARGGCRRSDSAVRHLCLSR